MERKFEDFIKAKNKLEKAGLYKGMVAFGSARIFENSKHYQEVVDIADLCAQRVIIINNAQQQERFIKKFISVYR